MSRLRLMAVALAALLLTSLTVGTATAATPYCGITWGSLPKVNNTMYQTPLFNVRAGEHDCFDRIVFEFKSGQPAGGYRVQYADEVWTEGQGLPMGSATNHGNGGLLQVTLLEPAYDVNTGGSTYPHQLFDHVWDASTYKTLRDVVYGGSFEGQTTFAVGVRARLPIRVLTLPPDAGSPFWRLAVDVAHFWQTP